jgi:hypothetical protein
VLYLFTAFLGVALGAGVYELRIVVPQWITLVGDEYVWHAQAAVEADTGRRFWAYVTTGPLTLLTLASLVLAFRERGPARRPWLIAAVTSLADRVVTFAYFIPTMLVLMEDRLPPQQAAEAALLWQDLDLGRQVLSLVAFLSALAALHRIRVGAPDPVAHPVRGG